MPGVPDDRERRLAEAYEWAKRDPDQRDIFECIEDVASSDVETEEPDLQTAIRRAVEARLRRTDP